MPLKRCSARKWTATRSTCDVKHCERQLRFNALLCPCCDGHSRLCDSTLAGYPIVVSHKCKASKYYSSPKDANRLNSPGNCLRQTENRPTHDEVIGNLRKHVHENTPGNSIEKRDRIGGWLGRPAAKQLPIQWRSKVHDRAWYWELKWGERSGPANYDCHRAQQHQRESSV